MSDSLDSPQHHLVGIRSRPFLSRLLDPLGLWPCEIELRSGDFVVVSGRGNDGAVSRLRDAPKVRKGDYILKGTSIY